MDTRNDLIFTLSEWIIITIDCLMSVEEFKFEVDERKDYNIYSKGVLSFQILSEDNKQHNIRTNGVLSFQILSEDEIKLKHNFLQEVVIAVHHETKKLCVLDENSDIPYELSEEATRKISDFVYFVRKKFSEYLRKIDEETNRPEDYYDTEAKRLVIGLYG